MPPAQSTSQQKAADLAMAAKQGKVPMSSLHGAAKSIAKMPTSSLRDYAKTKHGNLPDHVKNQK